FSHLDDAIDLAPRAWQGLKSDGWICECCSPHIGRAPMLVVADDHGITHQQDARRLRHHRRCGNGPALESWPIGDRGGLREPMSLTVCSAIDPQCPKRN